MAKRHTDPAKFSKALGLRIRKLREEKSWTLEDAEAAGWPNWTHLARIESGKNITIQTLVRLANLFGVHPSVLLQDI